MKFGRLANIEETDFSVPPLQLMQAAPEQPPKVYIGCPVWGVNEWKGKIYPPKAKPADYLYHYAQSFNTIELNTTHYRMPTVEMVEKWQQKASKHFLFCPKIPQSISHYRQLDDSRRLLATLEQGLSAFADTLGPAFLQLPPHFSPQKLPQLEKFLEDFPSYLRLAIEFRHQDWFADKGAWKAASDLLLEKNVGTVITDVAGRRDVLHQTATTSFQLIRFVGNNLHPSDYQRIDRWISVMEEAIQKGLQEIFFFVHEPDDINCPELIDYLIKQWKKVRPSLSVQLPRFQQQQRQLF